MTIDRAAARADVALRGSREARAFQIDEVAGAYAGRAMGLNGIATALWIPLLLRLLS